MRLLSLLLLVLVPLAAAAEPKPIVQHRSTGFYTGAWPIEKYWDDQAEKEWSDWVAAIGEARVWRSFKLGQGLKDPNVNPLFTPDDLELEIKSDCANLPFIMRAYFAYKTRRPLSFVSNKGRRYKEGNKPETWTDWSQYRDFQRTLYALTNAVSSASFRMHSKLEGTDLYPIDITEQSLVPGTTYYDPNGHVLIVHKVDNVNGEIQLLDSHPDGTLTRKTFGPKYAVGSQRFGGGFKRWRLYDVEVTDQKTGAFTIRRKLNSESAFYSENAQYLWNYVIDGNEMTYHEWVRARISKNGIYVHPIQDFSSMLDAFCHDVTERIGAVDEAVAAGVAAKDHPSQLPPNIYGAEGEWEDYSSPGRDARLRFSAKELKDLVIRNMKLTIEKSSRVKYDGTPQQLVDDYLKIWNEHLASKECQFTYRNSKGWQISLSLNDIFDRLFDLSFDCYHCPELRWGAPQKGPDGQPTAEFVTCPDSKGKLWWYKEERQLRNRITRLLDRYTATHRGPLTPVDVHIPKLMQCYKDNVSDPAACHK
jgi:hypothetical protein